MTTSAACPYREPTEREKEQARVIVGRIVTAFGNKIRGGDAQAREHAEWVVAGFPWAFQGSTPHRDLGVDVQPHVDPWDDAPVTFPRGLLALLVDAATKADLADLLGSECESDPCPVCTALVEGYEAVHPSD